MDIVERIYNSAKPFHPCGLFTGRESLEEMLEVFLSPQGLEFCVAHDFLVKADLQALKAMSLEDWGIWIDAGRKASQNARIVVLVGDCDFTLSYDTLEHPCRVVLLKGAKAQISASGYAVVSVSAQKGCSYSVNVKDHAVVR